MTKLLVLYTFHIYNDRVDHFIKKCIFYDPNIDFLIICSDPDMEFQAPSYTTILFRDNIGYDFGAWSDGLLMNNRYLEYDYFLFVNSSVIGPFIPSYVTDKWTDIYLKGLKNNIKLFGSTINCCDDPLTKAHVQSYIFSMDKSTLIYLIDCNIFTRINDINTQDDAIQNKEILMSRKIIEKGWNIGSLFEYYKDVDFTFQTQNPHHYPLYFLGDIMYQKYRGSLWNEYQLVFIKGNRVSL